MFGSVLNYVALRLLGCPRQSPEATKGQEFIKAQGGALYTASWAKFWLCVMGLMEWDGHNSVPPEMWMLPNWLPFHPGRMWCHARMVYLPMSYLYGHRYRYPGADLDPLIVDLRTELYDLEKDSTDGTYNGINFQPTRCWVNNLIPYEHWGMQALGRSHGQLQPKAMVHGNSGRFAVKGT